MVWKIEWESGNSLPPPPAKCAQNTSYSSPLIWNSVHSKGFPSLTPLTHLVKSNRFHCGLWNRTTERDHQNRKGPQIPLPPINRLANGQLEGEVGLGSRFSRTPNPGQFLPDQHGKAHLSSSTRLKIVASRLQWSNATHLHLGSSVQFYNDQSTLKGI